MTSFDRREEHSKRNSRMTRNAHSRRVQARYGCWDCGLPENAARQGKQPKNTREP